MLAKLSENQLKALQTLTDPENVGLSWKKKAELIGVTPRTLQEWRKDNAFLKAMKDGYKAELDSHRGEIDKQLIKLCKAGDLKAMKLYYELTGAVFEGQEKLPPMQAIQINIHDYGSKAEEKAVDVRVEYLE
jgi:hypothetical protein